MSKALELKIEQTQKLSMTPELIQAIKILQFNAQELNTFVAEQLMSNPVLELKELTPGKSREIGNDSMDWVEYVRRKKETEEPYRNWEKVDSEKKQPVEYYVASDMTLTEYLMFQLGIAETSEKLFHVAGYVVESLDENGYMTESRDEIAEHLNVSEAEVKEAVGLVQSFEPAGVGALDLKECLLLQLRACGKLTEDMERIIRDYLEDLAANRLDLVSKETGLGKGNIQDIFDLVKSLEPKPGKCFSSGESPQYITPDAFVEKTENDLKIRLSEDSAPEIVISSYYRQLVREAGQDTELSEYLNERLHKAEWLIKSIEQRKDTMMKTLESIVAHQSGFFEAGAKALKPLTLKDVAEDVGVHESTISRAINGKYLECSLGTFELKYFFGSGTGTASSASIKEQIKELIKGESAKHPFSDQKIAEILETRGIDISRRTVAKYREAEGILSSSKRKRF